MSKFNFVETYRSTGLSADSDTIKARQPAFEEILKTLKKDSKSIELARMYFGLPTQNIEWFRLPFFTADSTFSIGGNGNEVSLLAACLIEASEDPISILAAKALWLAGHRTPVGHPEFMGKFFKLGIEDSIQSRKEIVAIPEKIRPSTKDEATNAIFEFSQSLDFPGALEALRKLSTDGQAAAKSLVEQTKVFATVLTTQMSVLNEKNEIVWWHTGGWSRITDTPFSAMPIGSALVLAGFDLSALSRSWLGPVGVSAILHRTIFQGREFDDVKISIGEAVTSLNDATLKLLSVSDSIRSYADVCPVLFAIKTACETVGWEGVLSKVTGISADLKFTPTELATQVYLESNLLEAISEFQS